jgi:hypothetical protein
MIGIRSAILAVCLGMLGSLALHAQINYAQGDDALSKDNNGTSNEAVGIGPLENNYNGNNNSAYGFGALNTNYNGSNNSAFGSAALMGNYDSSDNSAFGAFALYNNSSGAENAAFGYKALTQDYDGWYNSAFGSQSLYSNIMGVGNSAFGYQSLYSDGSGNYNVASGYYALQANTGGHYNTAAGAFALGNNALGNYNVGIGYAAGYNLSAGATNNIDIQSWGAAGDNNIIRIGNGTHTAFYAAGVFGTLTSGGTEVYINNDGLLGTKNSSIRFKEDVHDMAAASDGLLRLRPVTYRYKQPYADGSKPIDYGLIAEEVAAVYPDLVVRDADGQIQTVQYQKLTPMLLNEVQKEHRLLEQQEATIEKLEKRLAALEAAQPSVKADVQLAEK